MLSKFRPAIGNRIGRPAPKVNVTKVTFRMLEYFSDESKRGPEYFSTNCSSETHFVYLRSSAMI